MTSMFTLCACPSAITVGATLLVVVQSLLTLVCRLARWSATPQAGATVVTTENTCSSCKNPTLCLVSVDGVDGDDGMFAMHAALHGLKFSAPRVEGATRTISGVISAVSPDSHVATDAAEEGSSIELYEDGSIDELVHSRPSTSSVTLTVKGESIAAISSDDVHVLVTDLGRLSAAVVMQACA